MKKLTIVAGLALVLGMSLSATDFSSYSTQELLDMKGSVAVEDRADFRNEMQDRISNMTPEERATYDIGAGGTNSALGIHDRLRDGSGTGSMNQGAHRGGRR